MTGTGADRSLDVDGVDQLLSGLTRFLLLHSAEGAFELRDTVRAVGRAYGVRAEVLVVVEGAVLTIRHPVGPTYHDTVRVAPELTRLDLVSKAKFLVNRILAGELSAAAASGELAGFESSGEPYAWWLRIIGVILFSAGFAPGVQQTWREVAAAAILGAVMGVLFVAADWAGGLRVLLPIVATLVVAVIAFEVLHAQDAPGGAVLLMIPGLFILIPGDLLCAATAEIAVGEFTPGAVRLAQAAVTLVQLAAGVIIAAELTGAGLRVLSQPAAPAHSLPDWLIAVAWLPFTVGLALTFNARMRDVPWMLLLVYLAWGAQELVLAHSLVVPQEGETGATAAVFVAATILAFAAGVLEQFRDLPPRGVTILAGFFALTVGAVALRGLTALAGNPQVQGFNDIRDATSESVALTLGLIAGAGAAAAIAAYRRRNVRQVRLAMADAMARAALIHPLQVPLWIDLTAVVVGALAGAGIAARERFDLIGALLLAVVMGLGGGIVRDLLLGLRPVAVTSRYYLPTAAAAAVAGFAFTSLLRRFGGTFDVLEALSVGLFTVVGVEKTLLYDLPYVTAIFVGVSAAVGGGVLVDLIAGRPVEVVRQGPWNATAALAGASVYVVIEALGAPTGASQAAAFSVVVGMRLAALRWGLGTPLPAGSGGERTARGDQNRKDGPGAEDAPGLRLLRTLPRACSPASERATSPRRDPWFAPLR